MKKVLVVYSSDTGNTKKMAKAVSEGVESGGAELITKIVYTVKPDEIKSTDAIILGAFGQR